MVVMFALIFLGLAVPNARVRAGFMVVIGLLLVACLLLGIGVLIAGLVSWFRPNSSTADPRWKPGELFPEGTLDVMRIPFADSHPAIDELLQHYPPTIDGRVDLSEKLSEIRSLAGEFFDSLQFTRAAHLWLLLSVLDKTSHELLRNGCALGASQMIDFHPRMWLIDDVKPSPAVGRKQKRVWEAMPPLPGPSILSRAMPKLVALIPIGSLITHLGHGTMFRPVGAVVICIGIVALVVALGTGQYQRIRYGRWLKMINGQALLSQFRGARAHPTDIQLTPENTTIVLVKSVDQADKNSTLWFFHFEFPPYRVAVEDFDMTDSPWSPLWREFAAQDRLRDEQS